MRFCIEDRVFEMFPNFCRGVVRASGIDNRGECRELEARLSEQAERVRQDPEVDPAIHARLLVWKEAYRTFGSNPNKFTPSIVFLTKQAKKGKPIRSISPAVDAFNIVSLKYLVPCGGDDLDTVAGDVTLGCALSGETFAPIFSPDAVEHPEPGEVIYVNRRTQKILCRRWNWRNADFSKISSETKNIAVNVDGMMPSISREEIEEAAEELRRLLLEGCGGKISIHYLDARNPVLEI
jgi:DNA/RNA-binding domain of Phe-tRNA-synthetase-like protein